METNTVIIIILVVIIVLLLILNYKYRNQINAKENMMSTDRIADLGAITRQRILAGEVPQLYAGGGNLKEPGDTIILYYTNWCGHSRNFLPIWDDFVRRNSQNIRAIKIDCEANKDKCTNVQGFPTVKLHRADGKVVDYQGPRSIDGLEAFIRQK